MFADLKSAVIALGSLCVLRSTPKALPRNHLLFGSVLVLSMASLMQLPVGFEPITYEAPQSEHLISLAKLFEFGNVVFLTATQAVLVHLALRIRKKQERTYSTIFAFFGTQVFIGYASLVVFYAFLYLPALVLYPSAVAPDTQEPVQFTASYSTVDQPPPQTEIEPFVSAFLSMTGLPGPFAWFYVAFVVVFVVWLFVVVARILSQSMEVSLAIGVLMFLALVVIQNLLHPF